MEAGVCGISIFKVEDSNCMTVEVVKYFVCMTMIGGPCEGRVAVEG